MTTPLTIPTLDELVIEITDMQPLDAVATRIIELTEGDRFSAHELAATISSDPALSAKMLRLSNSAYYGFPRQITTVRDAVVLLGFRAVRSATLASCMISTLRAGQVLDYERFWRFSVSIGMMAELLGRVEQAHEDEAFTAGVLHNIGRLALDQHQPQALEHAIQVAQREQMSLAEAERMILGFSDAELGGALALHWNFPEPLAGAVAKHQLRIEDLPDRRSLTAFVARARLFCGAAGLSDGAEPARRATPASEWDQPALAASLRAVGGFEGILERADTFLEHALSA